MNVTFVSMQLVHFLTGIQSSKPVAELPLLPNATALPVGMHQRQDMFEKVNMILK